MCQIVKDTKWTSFLCHKYMRHSYFNFSFLPLVPSKQIAYVILHITMKFFWIMRITFVTDIHCQIFLNVTYLDHISMSFNRCCRWKFDSNQCHCHLFILLNMSTCISVNITITIRLKTSWERKQPSQCDQLPAVDY